MMSGAAEADGLKNEKETISSVDVASTNAPVVAATPFYDGGEIVVSASRASTVETTSTTRTLTADELAKSGARDLGEALDLLPGLHTRKGNDGVRRVDIRGFRSRHVTLLLNGVPLNSTFDGQFDPELLPIENIAKIKVGYGNQSTRYGSGGLGGVINVITKTGEEGTHGGLSIEAGEGNRYMARASVSHATKKNAVFVSASRAKQDYYTLPSDFKDTAEQVGTHRENSDYLRDTIFASYTYSLENDWTLGLVGTALQGEYGKPPALFKDDFSKKVDYERIEDYHGYSAQVTFGRTVNEGLNVRSALFYNEMNEESVGYDDNTYSTTLKKDSYIQDDQNRSWGASLQAGNPLWSGAELTAFGIIKFENYQAETQTRDKKDIFQLAESDRDLENGTIGAELEQELGERVVLVGGYGYDWQRDDGDHFDEANHYMAGLSYDIFDSTTLHASYAHQVRFPSIKQLYGKNGNSDLTVETADNYEVGITQQLGPSTDVDITGFQRDVEDYIEKINKVTMNNDAYRFRGLEATLKTRPIESVWLMCGYSLLNTEDKTGDRDELQYRPRHTIKLSAEWTVWRQLSLYAGVQYVAGQYYYSDDLTQKERLDDYIVTNLRATYTIQKIYSIYAGIDNAFDELYYQSYAMPREGRRFYAGMNLKF